MKVKFGGYFNMKKLVRIVFEYEDGTADQMIDDRAALLFQSRANSSGLLSGIEDYILPVDDDEAKEETEEKK